jgi:hypothetical protein
MRQPRNCRMSPFRGPEALRTLLRGIALLRARPVMEAALIEAEDQDWRLPAIADEEE